MDGPYNVASELQNTLVKNAMLKRQAMMDDVTRQYRSAQMQNMQSEADYRKQQAGFEQQKMNMEQQKFAQQQAAALQPGQVTPDQAKLAESAYPGSTFQQPGETIPQQGPVQPGQEPLPDSQLPATTMFRGTPAYQAQQRAFSKLNELMQDPSWKTMSPSDKMMKVTQSGVDPKDLGPAERILAAELQASTKEEQVPYFDIDRQGNPIKKAMVPKNSIFKQQPAPTPAPPETQFSWVTKDEKGNDVVHFGIHPRGSNKIQELQNPGGPGAAPVSSLRSGNQPVPPKTKTPGLYDEKVLNQYRAALKSQNGAAAALSARNQFLASITDPMLKKDMQDAASYSVQKKIPFSQAAKSITPPEGTPEQQAAYMSKVNEVLSELVSQ
jgi:hypothetical protein